MALVLVVLLVFAGYQHFAKIYRKASKEVERLESRLRSNVYAHFAESLGGSFAVSLRFVSTADCFSLAGLQSLRSYDQVEPSISKLDSLLDLQNRSSFISATTQRLAEMTLGSCRQN